MKPIMTVAAGCMALTATGARAAQDAAPCLTVAEASTAVNVLAPTLLRTVRTKCMTVLPANSYLARKGVALAARYEPAAAAARPAAPAVFSKLAAAETPGITFTPQLMDMMIDGIVGPMIAKDIKAKDCPTINRVAELLDPLPAENMSALIVLVIELGLSNDRGKDKKPGRFDICPAQAG